MAEHEQAEVTGHLRMALLALQQRDARIDALEKNAGMSRRSQSDLDGQEEEGKLAAMAEAPQGELAAMAKRISLLESILCSATYTTSPSSGDPQASQHRAGSQTARDSSSVRKKPHLPPLRLNKAFRLPSPRERTQASELAASAPCRRPRASSATLYEEALAAHNWTTECSQRSEDASGTDVDPRHLDTAWLHTPAEEPGVDALDCQPDGGAAPSIDSAEQRRETNSLVTSCPAAARGRRRWEMAMKRERLQDGEPNFVVPPAVDGRRIAWGLVGNASDSASESSGTVDILELQS